MKWKAHYLHWGMCLGDEGSGAHIGKEVFKAFHYGKLSEETNSLLNQYFKFE